MGFINPGKSNRSRAIGKRHHTPSGTPASPRPHKRPSSSRTPTPPTLHTPPPLSRFESLPTELISRVFTHSYNLSLPLTSLHLAHTLSVRHLQLNYIFAHHDSHEALTSTFTLRFFTLDFLALFESRFGQVLDATGCTLPTRLLRAPWGAEQLALLTGLIERGARLDVAEGEVHVALLHEALIVGRGDVARVFVEVAGVKVDTEGLRLAMRMGDLEVCGMFVGRGVVADAGVWREAVGRREKVGWLLERGAPPGELLGALSV